jgi:hypothetical protein
MSTGTPLDESSQLYVLTPRIFGGRWAEATTKFVKRTGDTMTGELMMSGQKIRKLGEPELGDDAATKHYVLNNGSYVLKSGDTMTGELIMSSKQILQLGEPLAGTSAVNRTYCDLHVLKTGDTMTGKLIVEADIDLSKTVDTVTSFNKLTGLATGTADNDAVNLSQLNTALAGKVDVTGDTMTGALILHGNLDMSDVTRTVDNVNPAALTYYNVIGMGDGVNDNDAVNVRQLQTRCAKAGDTMTGNLSFGGTSKVTGLVDGVDLADAVTMNQLGTKVSKAGDTMTGNLSFGGTSKVTGLVDGVDLADAVTMNQLNTKVSKTGDTMTGPLAMTQNKITNLLAGLDNTDAANVEQVAAKVSKAGDTMSGNLLMALHRIKGMGQGGETGDAVTYDQLILKVDKAGDTMTGNLNVMQNNVLGATDSTVDACYVNVGFMKEYMNRFYSRTILLRLTPPQDDDTDFGDRNCEIPNDAGAADIIYLHTSTNHTIALGPVTASHPETMMINCSNLGTATFDYTVVCFAAPLAIQVVEWDPEYIFESCFFPTGEIPIVKNTYSSFGFRLDPNHWTLAWSAIYDPLNCVDANMLTFGKYDLNHNGPEVWAGLNFNSARGKFSSWEFCRYIRIVIKAKTNDLGPESYRVVGIIKDPQTSAVLHTGPLNLISPPTFLEGFKIDALIQFEWATQTAPGIPRDGRIDSFALEFFHPGGAGSERRTYEIYHCNIQSANMRDGKVGVLQYNERKQALKNGNTIVL